MRKRPKAAEAKRPLKNVGNITRPSGWTEKTHSNNADPDYETVFSQTEVNQITITISPDDWTAMQANMFEIGKINFLKDSAEIKVYYQDYNNQPRSTIREIAGFPSQNNKIS